MMCHEAKRHLDLFMDGELSVPENLKVLEHLNLCRPCASVYEGEKALRGSLKAQLGKESAPASLYATLSKVGTAELPASATPSRRAAGSRRWGAMAAAVFFVTLAAALLFSPSAETPGAFAAEAVGKHVETREGFCGRSDGDCLCLCEKCCPDRERPKEKFFRRHVGYDVCAHDLGGLGYSFVGVAVWRHRSGTVCWTVQRDAAGHSITHALVATPIAMDRGAGPLSLRERDHPVILVPSAPGMTCVFIFDDEREAARFRAAMKIRP